MYHINFICYFQKEDINKSLKAQPKSQRGSVEVKERLIQTIFAILGLALCVEF